MVSFESKQKGKELKEKKNALSGSFCRKFGDTRRSSIERESNKLIR